MEKIEILLEKLDNRITSSLAKRLDTLDDLQEKLEASGEDYEKNPTDENRESYNEVIEYVEKMELGIIKDLEALLEKRKAEELAKRQANHSAPAPNPSFNPTTEKEEKKEDKKEGSGVLSLIIGGVLLVASFGAINYFRKR
jgi:vacuolar-type H+-ATPase subunit I/STV1